MKRVPFLSLAVAGAAALATSAPGIAADDAGPHPVIELRQYKIVPGKRDAMIALFEREFVESQEKLGMRLVGQFRDRDDPSRFTWIRAFPSMEARGKALNDFYFGPVWQAHRGEANPLLDDNDDVLLLRPAWPGSGFGPPNGQRSPPGAPDKPAGLVVATIEYLWKQPTEGYAAYFRDTLAPAYRAAGLCSPSIVPRPSPTISRGSMCGKASGCWCGSRGSPTPPPIRQHSASCARRRFGTDRFSQHWPIIASAPRRS
jgi:hypothetical protein